MVRWCSVLGCILLKVREIEWLVSYFFSEVNDFVLVMLMFVMVFMLMMRCCMVLLFVDWMVFFIVFVKMVLLVKNSGVVSWIMMIFGVVMVLVGVFFSRDFLGFLFDLRMLMVGLEVCLVRLMSVSMNVMRILGMELMKRVMRKYVVLMRNLNWFLCYRFVKFWMFSSGMMVMLMIVLIVGEGMFLSRVVLNRRSRRVFIVSMSVGSCVCEFVWFIVVVCDVDELMEKLFWVFVVMFVILKVSRL